MNLYSKDGDGSQTKAQLEAVTKDIKKRYDVKVSSLAQAKAKVRNAKKPPVPSPLDKQKALADAQQKRASRNSSSPAKKLSGKKVVMLPWDEPAGRVSSSQNQGETNSQMAAGNADGDQIENTPDQILQIVIDKPERKAKWDLSPCLIYSVPTSVDACALSVRFNALMQFLSLLCKWRF